MSERCFFRATEADKQTETKKEAQTEIETETPIDSTDRDRYRQRQSGKDREKERHDKYCSNYVYGPKKKYILWHLQIIAAAKKQKNKTREARIP